MAKQLFSSKLLNFWDKLADLCAGGGRLIGMDANLSMFGVVPEMERRGVQVTLLVHHMEWTNPDTRVK